MVPPVMAATVSAHGPLGRIDARAKVLALLGVVMAVVSTPSTAHHILIGLGLMVLGLIVVGRVGPWRLLVRLAPLAPVLLVPATAPLMDGGRNWDAALGEMGKALIGCSALVLVAVTTPEDRLLAGMRGLGCPRRAAMAVGILLRYLRVLGDEALRLRRAAVARGWRARNLWQASTVGRWVGTLFLRSHDRAERVHAAMWARGFDGDPVLETPPAFRCLDGVFLLVVLAVAGGIRWGLP